MYHINLFGYLTFIKWNKWFFFSFLFLMKYLLFPSTVFVSLHAEFCIHIFSEVFGFYCLINFLLPIEQPYMEVTSSYSSGKVSELEIYIETNMGEVWKCEPTVIRFTFSHSETNLRSIHHHLKQALYYFFRTIILNWWSKSYHPCIRETFRDWPKHIGLFPSKT